MKYILGTIVTFIILSIATYFVLLIWDINLISQENFNKSLITLGVIFLLAIVLNIVTPFFFKNHSGGYDKDAGNVAQAKKR